MPSELFINRIIDQKLRDLKLSLRNVRVDALLVTIDSPAYRFDFFNEIYLLANDNIDQPLSAKVVIESSDNLAEFTPASMGTTNFAKYQFFNDYIQVTTTNYGADFVPFTLEFIRLTPIK